MTTTNFLSSSKTTAKVIALLFFTVLNSITAVCQDLAQADLPETGDEATISRPVAGIVAVPADSTSTIQSVVVLKSSELWRIPVENFNVPSKNSTINGIEHKFTDRVSVFSRVEYYNLQLPGVPVISGGIRVKIF